MIDEHDLSRLAAEVLQALGRRGWSIAAGESLTGGRVVATLVDVPGASAHVRGGVVAYATELKVSLLEVDVELLRERGPVDADVAMQMAEGARRLLAADVGLATTGVAGPDPQGGAAVGTVHIAVTTPDSTAASLLNLDGTRDEIRTRTVQAVLELALALL